MSFKKLFGLAMPKQRPAKPAETAEKTRLKREVLSQITELRQKLDPKVLRRVELAKDGQVPLDRDHQLDVVERFLAEKQDDGDLKRMLAQALEQDAARNKTVN